MRHPGPAPRGPLSIVQEVMDLITVLPADILCLSTMSEGTGDKDYMGVYHDDMD